MLLCMTSLDKVELAKGLVFSRPNVCLRAVDQVCKIQGPKLKNKTSDLYDSQWAIDRICSCRCTALASSGVKTVSAYDLYEGRQENSMEQIVGKTATASRRKFEEP